MESGRDTVETKEVPIATMRQWLEGIDEDFSERLDAAAVRYESRANDPSDLIDRFSLLPDHDLGGGAYLAYHGDVISHIAVDTNTDKAVQKDDFVKKALRVIEFARFSNNDKNFKETGRLPEVNRSWLKQVESGFQGQIQEIIDSGEFPVEGVSAVDFRLRPVDAISVSTQGDRQVEDMSLALYFKGKLIDQRGSYDPSDETRWTGRVDDVVEDYVNRYKHEGEDTNRLKRLVKAEK